MSKLHTKQSGNLGELFVATDLVRQGYYVFKEFGDICKADLIIMDETYLPIKVQVKALTPKFGAVQIKSTKSGPGYHFQYEEKHADIYAIYVQDHEVVLYISNKELLRHGTLTIRIEASKNNQTQKVNWSADYSDFKKALRDCTCNTLPGKAEGNEPVQTTTAMASES